MYNFPLFFLIFSMNGHLWPSDGPEADRGSLRETEGSSGRPTPPHADRGPLKPNNVGRQSTPQAVQRSAQDEQGPLKPTDSPFRATENSLMLTKCPLRLTEDQDHDQRPLKPNESPSGRLRTFSRLRVPAGRSGVPQAD